MVLFMAGAALLAGAAGAGAQQGVWSIITRPMFQSMLSHRGDSGCQGAFYTYDAFIEAASKFPGFGTTGDEQTRRRELAAFFGQTSHETTGTRAECLVLGLVSHQSFPRGPSSKLDHASDRMGTCRWMGDCSGWTVCLGILPGEGTETDGPTLLWTRTHTANSVRSAAQTLCMHVIIYMLSTADRVK
jgi:hypothetical protein